MMRRNREAEITLLARKSLASSILLAAGASWGEVGNPIWEFLFLSIEAEDFTRGCNGFSNYGAIWEQGNIIYAG
ncbi:Hypothetical predicted protein [Olea europaea subsp. europaea]|uniref:Uncharacterized protein n=1 Tax=Olea europaea subsp. europaea TaxID=158383 RepID=A0A8S0V361_OLEEU|nr:Hypothetical predicted protein [Olea europaea subsp. europaea]